MASSNWFSKLESVIFTILKTRLNAALKTKYPNLFCTTSSSTDSEPVFPTVYMHEVGSVESGMDLDNTNVNAVIETIQVDVTTNASREDCKIVTSEVIMQLKAMRFNIIMMPIYSTENNIQRGVVRARRTIGQGDGDIVLI